MKTSRPIGTFDYSVASKEEAIASMKQKFRYQFYWTSNARK